MKDTLANPKDKWIPVYFVMFFAVIVAVNSIFAYMAITTQPGVVTAHPYKKGLAFNETLKKARAQPTLNHKVSYDKGVLRWTLPIDHASVTASIVRPVKDGYDFDMVLTHMGGGVYEAKPDMPLTGIWTARLKATWDNTEFQTSHDFIAK